MDESISYQVLKMVLAQANKEQNQHYPPSIFEAHYELATQTLLDELIKLYPGTSSIVSVLTPYLKKELVIIDDGLIPFPKCYRNLLNFGLYLKDERIARECQSITTGSTEEDIRAAIRKSHSQVYDATMVSIGRWNSLTTHRYKSPHHKKAITCIFEKEGVRINPSDIPFVEMRYIKKHAPYQFGYQLNDDDTYYFDPSTTVEALWTDSAIGYLFKAVNTLYANYIKDPTQIGTAKDIRQAGLF